MEKIHLDTDLGGDIDDLCALAMVLRWSENIQLTGITTTAEAHGRRAGYVRYVLNLEQKNDIPVAAGADVSKELYRYSELDYPAEERYWPEPITPAPNPMAEAIELLRQSIEQGATIIAIGPLTNLYLLDLQYPGILMRAKLFLMGGYIYPIRPGFPDWGNDSDWNYQVDVKSAKHVLQNSNPTLVPLTVSVETALRRIYLEDLRKSGTMGQLIAKQAEEFAIDEKMESRFGATYAGCPEDLINFQHDALACAIALGWSDGVEIEELPLIVEEKDGWLAERIHPSGKLIRVVTKINGSRFNEFWFNKITHG
jgi:purine nucleosidase